MARRNLGGYSSLERHFQTAESYSTLSTSISQSQSQNLSNQISAFQSALSNFSSKHRHKILNNPEFRQHFSDLCLELGVDPLGAREKGVWDRLGMSDWYSSLGVQVVDVCLAVRETGGGMVRMQDLIDGVMLLRKPVKKGSPPPPPDISASDIKKALALLEPLGCGYQLITLPNGDKMIQCYPGVLDTDSIAVVDLASRNGKGYVTLRELGSSELLSKWSEERRQRAVEKAIDEGLAWVDDQGLEKTVWVIALFQFT